MLEKMRNQILSKKMWKWKKVLRKISKRKSMVSKTLRKEIKIWKMLMLLMRSLEIMKIKIRTLDNQLYQEDKILTRIVKIHF